MLVIFLPTNSLPPKPTVMPFVSLAEAAEPDLAPEVEVSTSTPEQRTTGLIALYSAKYGVSREQMYQTVKCETASTFDPTIQSEYVPNGKREESYGLAQIHLPDHPEISKTQTMDPDFAVEFMAKEFAAGHQSSWTCWRNIYSK